MKGKKQAAADRLDAQEKTLEERLNRFKVDILYYNRKRSPSVINTELTKHGFKALKIEERPVKKQIKEFREKRRASRNKDYKSRSWKVTIKTLSARNDNFNSHANDFKDDHLLSELPVGSFGRLIDQRAKGEIQEERPPELSRIFIDRVNDMANGVELEDDNDLSRDRGL